jgi:cyclase
MPPVPDRRRFLCTGVRALAGGALASVPLLAQAADPPRFHDLRRGVGFFTGSGGTIGWLVTPDGAVAVDSQFPATAKVCAAGLQARSPRGIAVLVNTHHHGDHTAGNTAFRAAARHIVQHEDCARLHRAAAEGAGGDAVTGLADTTFAGSWTTTIGAERIEVSYFGPAHTAGDVVVLFERANVVHLGDLVFNRIPPFVDRAAGASIRNWIGVLERIAVEHRDATFIFGHGRNDAVTGTVADVTGFRDYLAAVLEYVQTGVAAGRSQQEIAAIATLPGFPDYTDVVKTYASAFPLFTLAHVLTAMHQELTSPPGPGRAR